MIAHAPFTQPPMPEHLTALVESQDLLGLAQYSDSAREILASASPDIHLDPAHRGVHRVLLELHLEGLKGGVLASAIIARLLPHESGALNILGGKAHLELMVEKCGHPSRAQALADHIADAHHRRRKSELGQALTFAIQEGDDAAPILSELAAMPTRAIRKFQFESLDQIAPSPEEWRVHELLPETGVGFLAGRPGGGKSFLAVDWAMRLVSGRKVLDRYTKRCGVAYVAAEGANGVKKRAKGWQDRFQVGDGLPFHMTAEAPDLRKDQDITAIISELLAIKKACQSKGIPLGLIVIDTMSQVLPGADQNGQADMTTATGNARLISEKTGAFVLLIHHTGKDESRGLAGSFVLNAAADLVILLSGEKRDTVKPCLVDKLKDAADGWSFAFELEPVEYLLEGVTYKTCVPSYVDTETISPKSANCKGPKLSNPEALTLRAIHQLWDSGVGKVPAPLDPGVKHGQMALREDAVKPVAKSIGLALDDEKADTVRKRLDRALMGLVAHGKIRRSEGLLWPI